MLSAFQIDTLKVLRSGFRADIQDSEKALTRACKDPAWHGLRIKVRGEDVAALTAAIAMAESAAAPELIASAPGTARERDELREALEATKFWLRKLQPAMNIICSECLDDIIKDQIDPALSRAKP